MATLIVGWAATGGAAAAAPAFRSERITVEVQGAARPVGPDVILIPGLGSSPKVWATTVAAHPERRFHLVQVHGFAGTPVGGNAQGPVSAPVAEEVARYIREQGLKTPALIGHSMGGTIAIMTAARHPGQVGRLMVVDMIPFMGAMFGPPGTTPESVRPMADQIRTAMSAPPSTASKAQLKTMIDSMVRTENRRAEVLADSRASDQGVVARAFHELIVTDLRPELAGIKAPATVLYVRAAESPLNETQMDGVYRMSYAGLPGARLARVPDSAHFIMFDAAEHFQGEVRSFLSAPR